MDSVAGHGLGLAASGIAVDGRPSAGHASGRYPVDGAARPDRGAPDARAIAPVRPRPRGSWSSAT